MKIKFQTRRKIKHLTGNFKNKIPRKWKTTFLGPEITTTTSIWKTIYAEIKSAIILGYKITKSIFEPETVYHRCPECNLVIAEFTKKCDRCNSLIGWD